MSDLFDPTIELVSLRRMLNTDFPERAELAKRIRKSHASITSRLRRCLTALHSWKLTERQIRRFVNFMFRLCRVADGFVKLVVIGIAIYLFIEIGVAFLPGGAVERVLGGGQ